MGDAVNIVACGDSSSDFISWKISAYSGAREVLAVVATGEIWAVAMMGDIIKNDRRFHDVQNALRTAIAEGYKEIGLWGCDYSYPTSPIYEPGEDDVVELIKFAQSKKIEIKIPLKSEHLIRCLQESI